MSTQGRHPVQAGPHGARDRVREVVLAAGMRWEGYRRKWRSVWPAVRAALEEFGGGDPGSFLERLGRDAALRRALRPRLGITVSRFFRGRRSFETLARILAPDLPATGEIKAWSAGCACGEEPYTLAIVWQERIRPARPRLILRVLATDISEECLERARRGLYPASALRNVSLELRERYFERDPSGYRFRQPGGVAVEFQRADLLEDPPPAGCGVALCRNLAFTYFGPEGQETAWKALARALLPGGILVIGERESLPAAALRRPAGARESSAAESAVRETREGGAGAFDPVPGDRTVYRRCQ